MSQQSNRPTARFPLGDIVATPGAIEALREAKQTSLALLVRHQRGDWGDLDEEDQAENEFSLLHDLRLLSAYTLPTQVKIWVITEADRSVTAAMAPSTAITTRARAARALRPIDVSFDTVRPLVARMDTPEPCGANARLIRRTFGAFSLSLTVRPV